MGEKVGHVMCEVNRGQGGVSNYGETDCEERHTCLCVCVSEQQKRCIWTHTDSPTASQLKSAWPSVSRCEPI